MGAAMEIAGLSCGYGRSPVLKNIGLQIGKGEFVGIIGPNGSGKTTLLRAMTKVIKPSAGRIVLDGTDIWNMGFVELARKIAVVSQNLESASMTAEEFVLLGRIPHFKKFQFLENGADVKIARDALALTGALHLGGKQLEHISGGERQLVHIARALAQEPSLLLLDEPTAHLDITHQVKVLDLLKKLNRDLGLTVAVVLHDLNLAAEYCTRLALIGGGELRRVGSPEEVLDYKIIEDVYKTVVVVEKNPISKKPHVLLVSEDARRLSSGR